MTHEDQSHPGAPSLGATGVQSAPKIGGPSSPTLEYESLSITRWLWVFVLGILGAVVIWVIVPFNNFLLANKSIADDYLPVSVMFFFLILVIGINPLIRRFRPVIALNYRQQALILAIWLIACVPTSSGIHKYLPYSLAKATREVGENLTRARAYEAADLPPSLFPEPLGYGNRTPVSRGFLLKLRAGETIPWANWIPPLISWGSVFLCWWIMMLGLAGIMLPHWRNVERLPFPLLIIQRALIENPEPGRYFPPTLSCRTFWVAALFVFGIHFLNGLNAYFPQFAPSIPLRWEMSGLFADPPFNALPWWAKGGRFYFIFFGMAFFMPNRIAFSIFFFQLFYAGYIIFKINYSQPFHTTIPADHQSGAWLAMAVALIWLSRARWAHVFALLWTRAATEKDKRDRVLLLFFLCGGAGMFVWYMWAGAQAVWAAYLVMIAFIFGLVLARLVAETGIPLTGVTGDSVVNLIRIAPVNMVNAASIWLAGAFRVVFSEGNRVCVAVIASQMWGLDEKARPRERSRMAFVFVIVLLLAVVGSGAVHIYINYNHNRTLDGQIQPLGGAFGISQLDIAGTLVTEKLAGKWNDPNYSRSGQILLGAGVAGVLQYLCLLMPQFPLHPIGMLLSNNWFGNLIWISVFFGLMVKHALVFFGGARLFSKSKNFIIGLMVGEIAAVAFWAAVPAFLAVSDKAYKVVEVWP